MRSGYSLSPDELETLVKYFELLSEIELSNAND